MIDDKALLAAVLAYDDARRASHGHNEPAMSERNRKTIAPMISAAITAYLQALGPTDTASAAMPSVEEIAKLISGAPFPSTKSLTKARAILALFATAIDAASRATASLARDSSPMGEAVDHSGVPGGWLKHMTSEIAHPAPASPSTPGEEEIAALLRATIRVDASGLAPAVVSHYIDGFDEAARAILALFAPIVAEKERRIAEWQAEVRREGDRFKDEVRDLNAECERLEARALAAEAALAALANALDSALWKLRREGWDGEPALEQGEKVLEDYRAAAAIRAGE